MKKGFDTRIVSYEHIHSVTPEDFTRLVNAVDPQPGEVILDAMCGYGAVGKHITERVPKADVWYLDESEVQIQRAKDNISNAEATHFIVDTLPHDDSPMHFLIKL
ncbi:class I SAM-dependent methyltransferase [Candidatus Parcubacteria bacterium]|nr:class I SAM-dependent methyltransferase [Candidatus Parcubacteria bacterium]